MAAKSDGLKHSCLRDHSQTIDLCSYLSADPITSSEQTLLKQKALTPDENRSKQANTLTSSLRARFFFSQMIV